MVALQAVVAGSGYGRNLPLSVPQRRQGRGHPRELHAVRFADWQTEVAAIKKFGAAGLKTAVISTINGDADVPFYKELGNQGVKASDIPVVAFPVSKEELAGRSRRTI